MEYVPVATASELNLLLGKESRFNDFVYSYEKETVEMLKQNFTLSDSLYLWVHDGDTFAGFVSCDKDWWEADSFFLREIFIDLSYQGRGIGTELGRRCMQHAKAHGATTLVTQTAFDNIPMQHLCTSLGFVPWENPHWDAGITYKLLLK